MQERTSHGLPAKSKKDEVADTTVYYTIKGKQTSFNEAGFPVQDDENQYTYARETGKKKQIRLDDRGEFMNPLGLYAQRVKMERWVSVSDGTFASYLQFLKTKNQMFIRQAERNAV